MREIITEVHVAAANPRSAFDHALEPLSVPGREHVGVREQRCRHRKRKRKEKLCGQSSGVSNFKSPLAETRCCSIRCPASPLPLHLPSLATPPPHIKKKHWRSWRQVRPGDMPGPHPLHVRLLVSHEFETSRGGDQQEETPKTRLALLVPARGASEPKRRPWSLRRAPSDN